MKNIKKLVATITLAGIIIIGVTNANAGVLVGDFSKDDTNPCSEQVETKVDSGIIVSLTGIIVSFTGIIVSFNDDAKEAPTNCGIIVS